MIIESLQINGFGCITGEYEFSRGMNMIVAGNESGKTTLADALTAVLYGLKSSVKRNSNGVVLSRNYYPCGGEVFSAGAVVKTSDGRRLNIWRDFATGKLRVVELASGKDITLEFDLPPNGDCLGQSLTGLKEEQYRKLAFLSQDELNKEWNFVEFVDSLSAVFSTEQAGGVSIEDARSLLDRGVNQYEGTTGKGRLKVDTEIKRLQDRIIDIDEEIARINTDFERVEKSFEEAADRRAATDRIKNEIKKYDYLICLLQRDEALGKLGKKKEARDAAGVLQQEIESLAVLGDYEYTGIEDIAELLTLFSDKSERVEDIRSQKNTKLEELEYLEKRVDNLGKRANVTQDYLTRIEQAIAVLESNLGRERSVRIDCRNAENLMVQAGVDASEIRNYLEWKQQSKEVEVEFVANYLQIKEQIENKEQALKNARQEQVNILKEISGERLYRYKFYRNNLILGCVFTGLSVFFFVAMGFLPFMLIPAVACLIWAVFGAVRLVGVQNIAAGEEEQARDKLDKLDGILEGFAEKYLKMQEKLEGYAAVVGLGSDGLLDLIKRIARAAKEVENWQQRVDRHGEIEGVIEESYATLKDIFCEIGIADDNTRIDLTRARVFLREVSDALSLIEQFGSVQSSQDELTVMESELLGDISTLRDELEDIFARGGVEVRDDDLSGAFNEYKQRLQSVRRLEQLEDVLLPAAIAAAGNIEEIGRIEGEVQTWDDRIGSCLADDPWLETCNPELSIAEYGQEIELARIKLEDSEGELVEREKVLAVEDSRRREKMPVLIDERAAAKKALLKAERFRDGVGKALEVFESIATELHSRWSPLFSQEFNGYIDGFTDKIQFSLSRELKLCAVDTQTGAPVDSGEIVEFLSKGMRDQAYLSLRLLLLQKVSGGAILPVILDDPFVNADEERFVEGMLQLLELSRSNQIFVFSCHQLRHDALCSRHPEFLSSVIDIKNDGTGEYATGVNSEDALG